MTQKIKKEAEGIDAATRAILRANGHAVDGWIAPYLINQANRDAKVALEAACVPALLAENSRLNERIAELEAELATHQQSSFHPDWSLLQATTESLREAVARIAAYEEAIQEAEAIMGDEYGDHYGGLMELVQKARR